MVTGAGGFFEMGADEGVARDSLGVLFVVAMPVLLAWGVTKEDALLRNRLLLSVGAFTGVLKRCLLPMEDFRFPTGERRSNTLDIVLCASLDR